LQSILRRHAPAFVLATGVIFTLYLQTRVPSEVMFVDAGLKTLLAQQFSEGRLHADLRLPAEPWVQALWERGCYPFPEPVVYNLDGRRMVRFPFVFPLLTAPFVRLMGLRGLYVLPLLGAWLVWLTFLRACRALGVRPWIQAAVLASLIFATQLTLYTTAYWEHTLAVALAFAGLVLLITQKVEDGPRPGRVLLSAALAAASVWLREEHLMLVALLGVLALVGRRAGLPALFERRSRVLFIAGHALPPAAFFAMNSYFYGHPLGVHARFTLKYFGEAGWGGAVEALQSLVKALVWHDPLLLLAPAALLFVTGRAVLRRLLICLSVGFVLAVAFSARHDSGKDWGARYLLVLVPVFAVVAALWLDDLRRHGARWMRVAGFAAFAAATIAGAWINLSVALDVIPTSYARRLAGIERVRRDPARVVVISNQTIGQQYASLFEEKVFLLAPRADRLRGVAEALAARGESRALYVCYPKRGCGPIRPRTTELDLRSEDGRPLAHLSRVGTAERYVLFDMSIPSDVAGRPAAGAAATER
jgi:hypothetical protein